MRQVLPGPYTFILPASNKVPKILKAQKKTVGIRIPDNLIPRNIVKTLGNPIISASIKSEEIEYSVDPELIYEKYKKIVDVVIDGGLGDMHSSTVINCSGEIPELVRAGKGDVTALL